MKNHNRFQMRTELKTEVVKRSIVRYIFDCRLQVGDKLPSCAVLRRELGVGNHAISGALRHLADDGVIEVRDKVGMFVRNTTADGYAGRTIGVVCAELDASQFNSLLTHYIQGALQERGCRSELFYHHLSAAPKGVTLAESYPGLLRKIEQGALQGILWLTRVEDISDELLFSHGVEWVYAGTELPVSHGVFIDMAGMAEKALRCAVKQGYRHPGLVISSDNQIRDYVFPRFAAFCTKHFPGTDPEENYFADFNVEGGGRIAERLLELPEAQRPDVLILCDDTMAMGLASRLAYSDYRPKFMCVRNLQIPMAIPSPHPVDFFQFDLMNLAECAVDQLMNRLLHKEAAINTKVYLESEHIN